MKREIAILAGPRGWNDTRESWLARVPEKVPGISLRTIKSLYYGEIDDKHWAAIEIRNAVEIIETQRRIAKLTEQYETIARNLMVIDENFHCVTARQYLDLVHELRTQVGTRTKKGGAK
jgi:preprotein translocase subunit Sec63